MEVLPACLVSCLTSVLVSPLGQQLENSLNEFGEPWKLNPGDGAFYGPKVVGPLLLQMDLYL